MKKSTKTILIVVSSVGFVSALGTWIYIRKRNEAEVEALTNFINGSLTQNNLSTMSNEVVKTVEDLPLTKGTLLIDNVPDSNKEAFRNVLANVVVNLYASMAGGGTDTTSFYTNLKRIKNKATMKFVNTLYKTMYKESLFDAIQDEQALYIGTKTKFILDPFGISAKQLPNYSPAIVQYLASLK